MNRDQLVARIVEAALLHGDFVLRSGRKSNYYLDKYRFETQPDILKELGQLLADRVTVQTDRVAGAELGAIALVTIASVVTGKPSIFIRNQKKDYGTAKQIEGLLNPGDTVTMFEDIVTSGGQVIEGVNVLKTAGAKIDRVVAVIDRLEGGREAIEAQGIVFESLFTSKDLGINQ